jgi:hypothetical protein
MQSYRDVPLDIANDGLRRLMKRIDTAEFRHGKDDSNLTSPPIGSGV